ncbi:SusC/RagA family TonB-linked outer membrane protein [Gelidibacter salicanalis]|uniref:SusC/RagA family TonB-linked outer membrane protein n=1 Tax=Gelidibacter salicanalis TaxID=291193 RepID=A0A934KUD2_9FLAO|nr:SusC/RagA family TonB-linked outer membrane protein [Gelidibacter salicanalis]MBJ7881531.1 SusC/RagA family TonB-linked outer membrane protein [Gelidibacter salicanalis]
MKVKRILVTKNALSQCLLILFLILHGGLSAQNNAITIQGTVTGEDGLPVPGVTIVIQGTTTGTASDFDGNYTIQAAIGDVLSFSYVGYQETSLKVKSATLNVVLLEKLEGLDEVVVIGYGTVKKKEVTGALTQLTAEEITRVVSPDLGSALQGQVAGVNIVSSSTPGGESEILVRGITSLNDNTPLYVVDGIAQNGNPNIPPSDIESLVVLRDAASTAIYGVRGATGVILITTKKGRPGSLQVRSSFSYAVQDRRKAVPLMNSVEQTYFDVIQSFNVNGNLPEDVNLQILQQPLQFQNETDINNLVFVDQAAIQNHNLTISGGTEEINYNVSLGYFNEEGLQINSGFERLNMRANTVYEKNKLRVQTSLGLSFEERDIPQNNLLSQAIIYRPTQNGLDLNIIDNLEQGGDDVIRLGWVLESLRTTNNDKTTRVNASTNISYKLLDNLTLTTNLGITKINSIGKIIRPYTEIFNTLGVLQSQPENSYIDNRTRFTTNSLAEIGATYESVINEDHEFTFTGFVTAGKNISEAFSARRAGVTLKGSTVLDLATGTQSVSSGFDYTDTSMGVLARIQYTYKGRYTFSSSLRRDGSSKFSALTEQWGTFPAVAAAWNIDEEPFWEKLKSSVNSFRFRISQGTSGVDRTRSYAFDPTLTTDINYFGYNPTADAETIKLGVIQEDFANELLKWETRTQTNFGIDLSLFKNKLTIAADYYYSTNDDMLFPIFLPPSAGGGENAQVILNVGNMVNTGFELALGHRGKVGKLNYGMNGTFSTNKNEITKINGDSNFLLTNDFGLVGRAPDQSRITALAVGHEAASFYLWRTNGIIDTEEKLAEYQSIDSNARMGDTRYIDQDDNGILDASDRVYSGSGLPEFEIGYNLNANYKNFDFSMNWYASIGQEIMNGFDAWAYGFGRHKDQVYQWSPVNPVTPIPAFRNDIRRHPNYLGYSDAWLEDGSYLRLKQVSLGYSIPKQKAEKWGFNRFRLYLRAQNLLTFTKYSGYNPEIGGGISGRGLDKDTGPISVQYYMGVNFDF